MRFASPGIDPRTLPEVDPRLAESGSPMAAYGPSWILAAMTCDLLRSQTPDQYVFDFELHAFSTSPQRFPDMPPDHGRLVAG